MKFGRTYGQTGMHQKNGAWGYPYTIPQKRTTMVVE